MYSSSSRGTLAMKHVLDKYSNMASFSEEGGVPLDEISNADLDMPPMGMSPVSHLIKKMASNKVHEPKSTSSTPIRNADQAIRRAALAKIPAQSEDSRSDYGGGRPPINKMTSSTHHGQQVQKAPSSTNNARSYFSDMLNQLHDNPSACDNAPRALLEALKGEIDALAAKNRFEQFHHVEGAQSMTDTNRPQPTRVRVSSSTTGVYQPRSQNDRENEAPRASHIPRPAAPARSAHSSNNLAYSYAQRNTNVEIVSEDEDIDEEVVEVEGFSRGFSRHVEQPVTSLPPRPTREYAQPVSNQQRQANAGDLSTGPLNGANKPHNRSTQLAKEEELVASAVRKTPLMPEPQILHHASALTENPDPNKQLTVESTLPDLIKYQLQARLLELGLSHDSENFARANRWAYYHVASEVNACLGDGFSISYCCLKRLIVMMARVAVSIYK